MSGWSQTIRTGNPQQDLREVEQHRHHAAAQGLSLHVQPLATGGYLVTAAPPVALSQLPTPAPSPAVGVGATLPSSFGDYRPSQAGAPAPGAFPQAQLPSSVMGTMPSRLGPIARPEPAPQVHMATPGGECQLCGRIGPTKHVHLMQNIGVVVIRFPKTINGHLCKFCIDQNFFKMTAITMLLGWWGMISFVYSLVSIPVNVFNWIGSIGMGEPPEDSASIAARRSRALVMILLGVLLGLVAAAFTLLGLGIIFTDPDVEAGIEAALVGLIPAGLPALFLLAFGIRGRMKATKAERRLSGATA